MIRLYGLMAAIALQFGVVVMEYLGSVWPLWTGDEVRLEIAPVDPRSMFRGNYARLGYTAATLDAALFDGPSQRLRKGELVYVILEEGADEVWNPTRVQLEHPGSGVFLRGRLTESWPGTSQPLRARYGIEAWFAPKVKALEIEKAARRGQDEGARAYAVVAVSRSGRAALARLDLP